MALFKGCCFWSDVRSGSIASGTFTMTFAFVQLVLQLAVWIGAATPRDAESWYVLGPKLTTAILEDSPYFVTYIPLACLDVILIFFSGIMLVAIDKDVRGRMWLMPWLIFLPIYVLYETGINVYLAVHAFDAQKLNWPFALPVAIAFYWFVKLVINIGAFLCVISRYQELSKYSRAQEQRASIANSFDREYPGGYLQTMTNDRAYSDEYLGRTNGHPYANGHGYSKARPERDYRRPVEHYDRYMSPTMPVGRRDYHRHDYEPRSHTAGYQRY